MLPLQPPTPPPLGDVLSSTRRCANCRRDQKGRIQTIYLLYTPKIDSSGRQNGAHIAKNGLKIIAKLILGIRSALLGSSLRRSDHQEADQAEIERVAGGGKGVGNDNIFSTGFLHANDPEGSADYKF